MNGPFFTVCILTYNYGKYIEQAIDSVINQSFRHWEMIVFDDASSDNTEELVRLYLHDGRVSYVRHRKNIGQGANWAQALKSGTGNVICTLHADDFWEKDTLLKVFQAFSHSERLDIISANWVIIGTDKVGPVRERIAEGRKILMEELKKSTMLPSSTFIKRKIVNRCDMPSSKYKLMVDVDYLFRLLLNADLVKSIQIPLLNYRVHEQSATENANRLGISFTEAIDCYNNLREEFDSSKLKKLVDHQLSEIYLNSASYNLKRGNNIQGFWDLKNSFNIYPFMLFRVRFLFYFIMYLYFRLKT